MLDLNDLRIFEKVASLRSFAAAARALELPKSSVSRSVARLEAELGTRLLQRTTRQAVLTEAGMLLKSRCAEMLTRIGEAVDLVSGFSATPRGRLRISAGIGFSVHVLGSVLPQFLEHNPGIEVSLRIGTRSMDLARISHKKMRIGAPNQRKLLCRNDIAQIRGTPRCRQSVTRNHLILEPWKVAVWKRHSMAGWSPPTQEHCCWERPIERSE